IRYRPNCSGNWIMLVEPRLADLTDDPAALRGVARADSSSGSTGRGGASDGFTSVRNSSARDGNRSIISLQSGATPCRRRVSHSALINSKEIVPGEPNSG